MDSIHLFRALDFDDAMNRAVQCGKQHEEDYVNADGERVRWRLAAIVSLDLLSEQLSDGVEVYSEPVDAGAEANGSFDRKFHPEESKPTQTL
jgi:hypothetical protein